MPIVELQCPRCKVVRGADASRRSHEDFCDRCDYPLFLAPGLGPPIILGGASSEARKRLPGARGMEKIGRQVCPNPSCGEHNPLGEQYTHCWRCETELNPKAIPQIVEINMEVEETRVEIATFDDIDIWGWIWPPGLLLITAIVMLVIEYA